MFPVNAKKLQEMRARLNWTQRDVARKCKVSVRTVQGWESGRRIGGLARMYLSILEANAKPGAQKARAL